MMKHMKTISVIIEVSRKIFNAYLGPKLWNVSNLVNSLFWDSEIRSWIFPQARDCGIRPIFMIKIKRGCWCYFFCQYNQYWWMYNTWFDNGTRCRILYFIVLLIRRFTLEWFVEKAKLILTSWQIDTVIFKVLQYILWTLIYYFYSQLFGHLNHSYQPELIKICASSTVKNLVIDQVLGIFGVCFMQIGVKRLHFY